MAFKPAAAPDQVSEPKRAPLVLAVAFYAAIGLLWLMHFAWTLADYPLANASTENATWSSAWALLAISDYYAGALGICGVILATEQFLQAVLWCAFILVLGSPVVCIYFFQIFRWYGGFSLRGHDIYQKPSQTSAPNLEGTLGIGYTMLGLAIIIRFIWNQVAHSLILWDTEDASWSFEWFITSWANFYVLILCFNGMVLCSQAAQTSSAWCVATLLLGSPACCAFLAFRLVKYRTIAIGLNANEKPVRKSPSGDRPVQLPPRDKHSFAESTSDRGGGDVVRIGSKDREVGNPAPRLSAREPDFGEQLSARSGGHGFTDKGSRGRAGSKDFGQTWSQRSSRRGSTESGARSPGNRSPAGRKSEWAAGAQAPRVLVQHTTSMGRSASKDFGEANSARQTRPGSKDASGQTVLQPSTRPSPDGRVVTHQGYQVEQDEPVDAI